MDVFYYRYTDSFLSNLWEHFQNRFTVAEVTTTNQMGWFKKEVYFLFLSSKRLRGRKTSGKTVPKSSTVSTQQMNNHEPQKAAVTTHKDNSVPNQQYDTRPSSESTYASMVGTTSCPPVVIMTPGWFRSSTTFMKLFGMPVLLFKGRTGNSASYTQTTYIKWFVYYHNEHTCYRCFSIDTNTLITLTSIC